MASNRGEERSTTNDNLNVSREEVRPLLRKPPSLRASYSHDVYHLKPWDTTSQNHLLFNNSSPGLQSSQRHNGHSNTSPIPRQPPPPHSTQPQQISYSLRHLKRILSHISILGDNDHNVRPAKHVVLWLLLTFILFTVLAGVAAGNPTEAMRVSFGVFGVTIFVCLTGGVGWEIWKSSK
jgi:hypothetical protein